MAAGELAIVFRYRIPITGGNLRWIGVSDGAAFFIELLAQLQFQRVDAADELLVHLLHQRGIARETAGIETAHLIDENLQLFPRFRTVLNGGAHLVENVQTLIDIALGVGRVRTLLGSNSLTHDVRIAGIEVAIRHAAAIAARRIPHWTGLTIAHRARLATALTSRLLASGALTAALAALTLTALLAALTGLTALLAALAALLAGLAALSVAAELLALHRWAALLAAAPGLSLSGLSLSRLRVGTSAKAGEPVAQTR